MAIVRRSTRRSLVHHVQQIVGQQYIMLRDSIGTEQREVDIFRAARLLKNSWTATSLRTYGVHEPCMGSPPQCDFTLGRYALDRGTQRRLRMPENPYANRMIAGLKCNLCFTTQGIVVLPLFILHSKCMGVSRGSNGCK